MLTQEGYDWTDGEYTIKSTCGACPEQYDMLDNEGNTVGYFRLRHGKFTVEYPDVGGKLVYFANPAGDGIFEECEREYFLTKGYLAIVEEINKGQSTVEEIEGTIQEMYNVLKVINSKFYGYLEVATNTKEKK